MRWIGVLFGQVKAGLAATGGVHTHEDAVKLIMSGADVVQLCSAILTHGPKRLAEIEKAMREWMTRARVRIGEADERLHEPAQRPRSGVLRAGQLHEGADELPVGGPEGARG